MRRALFAVALTAAAAQGMSAPQGPVVGTSAEIVRLDAVVTDRDGNLARDLSEEDFALFEDGKPQTLTHFLSTGAGGAAPTPGPARAGTPGTEPGRYFVILVDDVHIARGDLPTVKVALGHTVGGLMTGENRVAVLTTTSAPAPYSFEEDWPVVLRAIDALSATDIVPPAPSADMTPVTAELILRGDRGALRLASRRLIDDPTTFVDTSGPRASVSAVQGPMPAGIDPSEKVAADEAQRQARGILLQALRYSALTLSRLEGVVRGLAALPGRKVCLLVSDGFLVGDGTSVELRRDLERIVDAATRSGTVVYALDAEGVSVTSSDVGVAGAPSNPGLEQSVARQGEILYRKTLESVAGGTGGFLIRGTDEFSDGLARMLDESGAHYVMAYTPTNTRRDGKFRKIELKLPGHKDYTVRTRRGYLAPNEREDPGQVAAGVLSASLSDDALWALLEDPLPESGIPVHLTSGFLDRSPLGSQVLIRANVDLREIAFHESDSHHRGTVELLGGVYDEEGYPVGAPFRRVAELDWSDAELERNLTSGLPYEEGVPLGPGRYQVRLLARDANAAAKGGARQWVEVPDLGNHELAASTVFLGSEEQAARGVRRFKRSEDLAFELYVYNPLVDASGESDVVMQAQIWSKGQTLAASKPEPVVFQETAGVPEPQGNSFPLAGLEPGSYELRVVVVDRKANATVTRSTDFTVE